MQELFPRARAHSDSLCEMGNPRAWLYRAVRNLLAGECRTVGEFVELKDDTPLTDVSPGAISTLDICLSEAPQVLLEDEWWLAEESDLDRHPQQSLADELGITLVALKSRLLRTRKHLKGTMTEFCRIEVDDALPVCCYKKMN